MRKQLLIVEQTQFDRIQDAPQAFADVEEAQVRDDRVLLRGDAPRRPPRPPAAPARAGQRRPEGMEMLDPGRFVRFQHVDVVVCWSMADAEEYVGEVLARSPQYKFVIYEATAFLEVVATPTVKKKWDQNGQFVDVI